jgi:hypothetical protein
LGNDKKNRKETKIKNPLRVENKNGPGGRGFNGDIPQRDIISSSRLSKEQILF